MESMNSDNIDVTLLGVRGNFQRNLQGNFQTSIDNSRNNMINDKTYEKIFSSISDKFSPELPEFMADETKKMECPYNIIICYIDVSGSTFNVGGRFGCRGYHKRNVEVENTNKKTKIICIAEMECISHLFVSMANRFIFKTNMIVKVKTFSDYIYDGAVLNNVTSESLYEFAKIFPMDLIFNSSSTATNLVFDDINQSNVSTHKTLCVLATDGQPNDKIITMDSVKKLIDKIKLQCFTMMIIGSGSISSEKVLPFSRSSRNGIVMDISITMRNENHFDEKKIRSGASYSECDIEYIRSLLDFFSSSENLKNIYVGAYGDYNDAIIAFDKFFINSPPMWKAYIPYGIDNNPIICGLSLSQQIETSYIKKIATIAYVHPYGNYLIFPIDNQFGYNIVQVAITQITSDIPNEIMTEIENIKKNIKELEQTILEYPTVIWHNAAIYDGCICDAKFYILSCEKIIKTNIINEQNGEEINENNEEEINENNEEEINEHNGEEINEHNGEEINEHNEGEINEHYDDGLLVDISLNSAMENISNILNASNTSNTSNVSNEGDVTLNSIMEYELIFTIYLTQMTESDQLRLRKLYKFM